MTSNISKNYSRNFFLTKSFFNSLIKKKRLEINRIIEEEINFEKSKNDVERLNVCVFFLVVFTFSGRTFNSFVNCFVHVAAHALFFD